MTLDVKKNLWYYPLKEKLAGVTRLTEKEFGQDEEPKEVQLE